MICCLALFLTQISCLLLCTYWLAVRDMLLEPEDSAPIAVQTPLPVRRLCLYVLFEPFRHDDCAHHHAHARKLVSSPSHRLVVISVDRSKPNFKISDALTQSDSPSGGKCPMCREVVQETMKVFS